MHSEAQHSEAPQNGTGPDLEPPPVPSTLSADCALAALPPEIHAHIHKLEARILYLETEHARIMHAAKFAGKQFFDSPSGKMFAIAFPKEIKEALQSFFSNAVTEKNDK